MLSRTILAGSSRLAARPAAAATVLVTAAGSRAVCRAFNRMPLRAKLPSPPATVLSLTGKAQMSSSASIEDIKEDPSDPPEDVLFQSLYGLRTIELNNQPKLNALDGSMIRKITPRLREWSRSDLANVVVIKGAGPKAMCAGGDVNTLARQNLEGPEGVKKSAEYFALEYRLDHYIATYKKPLVAFMDGITMGGGVGLSMHAPFRIATERTVFAMPETNIGFFPDVGGTFFLPKMNGELGTYLALTSDRIKGVNVYWTGVATHYLHSAQLPALEQRLAELRFHDYDTYEQRLELVNHTIEEFATGMPWNEELAWGGKIRGWIDKCFSHDTVPEIIAALEELKVGVHAEAATPWVDSTIKTIRQRSPTAVSVALEQLRVGRDWSIAEVFRQEHKLAARFMAYPDFSEGVLALLGKPRRDPQWKPATLEAMIDPKEHVGSFYKTNERYDSASGAKTKSLTFWSPGDYHMYPYKFGVPTEYDVYRLIDTLSLGRPGGPRAPESQLEPGDDIQIADASYSSTAAKQGQAENEEGKNPVYLSPREIEIEMMRRWRGKQGIEPVIRDILQRRGRTLKSGKMSWRPTEREVALKAREIELEKAKEGERKEEERRKRDERRKREEVENKYGKRGKGGGRDRRR
ncbi:putative 3-hydroxyisobutyryl- hydrolase protein [Zalerion maritima]|uniref:3-hydroxyisobutyryl-CoA hydrolase n=1 Tax=Zalerion maritima TaxID=339359 RepID=A0AAD5WRV0_9PEZI|nr:putative 3-hydroxyisobutyryl- hydrolase protein [Zalerion maritima]